ncbi:MAG: Protein-export membrane protein SecF, partial [Clostridiales bacterium 38_11]
MSIKVISKRNIYFIISLAFILIGLILIPIRGLNVGIDFSGGTLLQIELGRNVEVSEIRELTDSFDTGASIVHAGEDKTQVIIRTTRDLTNQERYEVFSTFQEKYDLSDDDFIYQQKFEPSIGSEIQSKAVLSVIIASIGILIYITFRFELLFGIAAVAALMHDVLIGVSVYS